MKKLFIIIIGVTCLSCHKDQPHHGYGSHGSPWIQTCVIQISDSSWNYDSTNHFYYTKEDMSTITDNVIYNGSVDVYLGDYNSNQQMPLTEQGVWYDYYYQLNLVEFKIGLSDGSIPSNPGYKSFVIVITQW